MIEATNKDFIEKVKILRANLIDYFNHKHPDTYDKNSFNSAGYLSLVLDSDSNEAGSFRICLNLNIPGQKELRCIHVFTYWDVFPKIGSAPIISMVSTINTDSAKNKDHNINYEIEVDGVRRPDYGMAEILDELDNPEIITYLRASDKK